MTPYEEAIQAARRKFDAAQRAADAVLAASPRGDEAAARQWSETLSRARETVRAERAAALALLLPPRSRERGNGKRRTR
jgi:hypothetical protein